MMNKIFHYNGLEIEVAPDVYDPAEDTFLLIDSLDVKLGEDVLEIGTGSGIIALECARRGANVVCVDINPNAVELAKRNYLRNKDLIKGKFEARVGDLFSKIKENYDLIIFDPPYLPTSPSEKVDKWFDAAVDGGSDGLRLTKKYIEELPKHIKKMDAHILSSAHFQIEINLKNICRNLSSK